MTETLQDNGFILLIKFPKLSERGNNLSDLMNTYGFILTRMPLRDGDQVCLLINVALNMATASLTAIAYTICKTMDPAFHIVLTTYHYLVFLIDKLTFNGR